MYLSFKSHVTNNVFFEKKNLSSSLPCPSNLTTTNYYPFTLRSLITSTLFGTMHYTRKSHSKTDFNNDKGRNLVKQVSFFYL